MSTDKRIEHTPLWFDGSTMRVKNNFNDTIAVVFEKHEGLEIVRACNHFYEMREALEDFKGMLGSMSLAAHHEQLKSCGIDIVKLTGLAFKIESILKKIE